MSSSYNTYLELGKLDLSNCNREPVQFIESIQPCAYLLAWEEATLTVSRASRNLSELGWNSSSLVGQPLPTEICGLRDRVITHLERLDSQINECNPFLIQGDSVAENLRNRYAYVYRSQGQIVLEIEKEVIQQNSTYSWKNSSLVSWLSQAVARMQVCQDEESLSQTAAQMVREISGYDRVNIYRLDPIGHGKVIGEASRHGTAKFLNLWFPSSDIPPMARKIFDRMRVRLIADTLATPCPLDSPVEMPPLNLTECQFRAVSPIHLQYLANMGVKASLVISLHFQNNLWGLIACHHEAPLAPDGAIREVLGKFGQSFSIRLGELNFHQGQHLWEWAYIHKQNLQAHIGSGENSPHDYQSIFSAYMQGSLWPLMTEGAMVFLENEFLTYGITPAREVCELIRQLVQQRHHEPHIATSCLQELIPQEQMLGGMLAFPFSYDSTGGECVVWFRPVILRSREWAGDPLGKISGQTENGAPVLTPRASFGKWLEIVKGESLPWTQTIVECASILVDNIKTFHLNWKQQLSAVELIKINYQLQAAAKAKNEFLAHMSHELRTPLNGIIGFSQIMADGIGGEVNSVQKDYLQEISINGLHLLQLINDLLDMSKIESGKMEVHPETFSLPTMISEVCSSMRPLQLQRAIDLTTSIAPDLDQIFLDKKKFKQVLYNLLSNAIKFSREKGQMRIVVVRKGIDYFTLAVSDNGIGIKPEDMKKLFKEFEQIDSGTTRQHQGTGLGLALAHKMVQMQGGSISVESQFGQGSTFTVKLPLKMR